MKAVVQRARSATLNCDGKLISQINKGLVVYFGVAQGDTRDKADYLAAKIAKLRVFEDENGKMNLSVLDVGGEILAVSQFTLIADTAHGNRPSYSLAEDPQIANEMYEYFIDKLRECGVPTKRGVFGGNMDIDVAYYGPVTIIYDV